MLKTSHFSIAQARLATTQKEHQERSSKEIDSSNAKMTFGEAAALRMERLDQEIGIKSAAHAPTALVRHDLHRERVDIPTISRWLGQKDGGVLAMKTYGHLRREHGSAQARKVSFAPIEDE